MEEPHKQVKWQRVEARVIITTVPNISSSFLHLIWPWTEEMIPSCQTLWLQNLNPSGRLSQHLMMIISTDVPAAEEIPYYEKNNDSWHNVPSVSCQRTQLWDLSLWLPSSTDTVRGSASDWHTLWCSRTLQQSRCSLSCGSSPDLLVEGRSL